MNKIFPLFLFFFFSFSQNEKTHVIYFETDKYDILEIEKNRLLLFADRIKKEKIKKISIYGFCDDRGSNSYNLTLSQNRANTIKNILLKTLLNPELITSVDGKGELLLEFVKTEDISIARGLNRKVEIKVVLFEEIANPALKDKLGRKLPLTLDSDLMIGDKIVLKNILFKTGYSYVLEESIPVLENIVKKLLERDNLSFVIEGHVCCTSYGRDAVDRGTGKRNLSLSRARYIYSYFLKKGVDKKRMKYTGLKHLYPLGGDTKFDRRVEIEITYIKN
jgi:outer membrane protein OmpA-like peptidoglycan-associated protein